jgi:hypothetical protein
MNTERACFRQKAPYNSLKAWRTAPKEPQAILATTKGPGCAALPSFEHAYEGQVSPPT